jgi:hypothetical protein
VFTAHVVTKEGSPLAGVELVVVAYGDQADDAPSQAVSELKTSSPRAGGPREKGRMPARADMGHQSRSNQKPHACLVNLFAERTPIHTLPAWAGIDWDAVEANVRRLPERIDRATTHQAWQAVDL